MSCAIIIIGGYNSIWPSYLRMAREIEDLSGVQAIGVPLLPWHWWWVTRHRDASGILSRLRETVDWARRRYRAKRFVLVGHSAGGLIARLFLSDVPQWGHTCPGPGEVVAVVTLGSPHCSHRKPVQGGPAWFLVDTANSLAPGTMHAPRVRYVAVAGKYVRGNATGVGLEKQAFRLYEGMGGRGDVWGDGMVSLKCASLDGANCLVLNDVAHSSRLGSAWYGGSKTVLRRWWPHVMPDAT